LFKWRGFNLKNMVLIEKIELEKCFCFEKAHLINEGDNKVNMLRCFMFW